MSRPLLIKQHKEKRVKWAIDYIKYDFSTTIFTDDIVQRYTLKTSGLKYPGHLKMTQFGSNVLLLTRLVVTLGSVLEENV